MHDKEQAAVYGTKSDGSKALRGYHAVDPKGNLVLLNPRDPALPGDGWRWATPEDVAAYETAAAAILAGGELEQK
jgi:hypothetical protein